MIENRRELHDHVCDECSNIITINCGEDCIEQEELCDACQKEKDGEEDDKET